MHDEESIDKAWKEVEAYLREILKCEDYEFPCPQCGGYVSFSTKRRDGNYWFQFCATCNGLGKITWIDKIKMGIQK